MKHIGIQIILFLLTSCVGIGQTDCAEKYSKEYIPVDLNTAIDYLDCIWDKNSKKELIRLSEDEAMAKLHFGTGLSIRNSWGLWKGKNELTAYFNSLNIHHPDDMSSIILTSFYRHLKNQDIKLDEQVAKYIEYWTQVQKNEVQLIDELNNSFSTYKIGTRLNVYFQKEFNDKNRIYGPINNFDGIKKESKINSNKFCAVNVEIFAKEKSEENMEFILKTKVLDICQLNKVQYGTDDFMEIGHVLDINLLYNPLMFKQK